MAENDGPSERKARLEERQNVGGAWYLVLVASNGEDLMVGEAYSTKAKMKRGADDVKVAFRQVLGEPGV